MARTTSRDAQALFQSLRSAYTATPTSLKVSLSLSLSFISSIFDDEALKLSYFWCPDYRSVCGFCSFHCYNSGTAFLQLFFIVIIDLLFYFDSDAVIFEI
jgi:hypothetical protein